jgi:hypothetical protein
MDVYDAWTDCYLCDNWHCCLSAWYIKNGLADSESARPFSIMEQWQQIGNRQNTYKPPAAQNKRKRQIDGRLFCG